MHVVLVAKNKSGKTSLLARLCGESFSEKVISSSVRTFYLEGKNFTVMNSPKNIASNPHFYSQNPKLVIACIDLTRPSNQEKLFLLEQLIDIKKWCPSMQVILVGTKWDQSKKNDASKSLNIIKDNLESKGIKIHSAHLTSAKTGYGLDELKASLIEINEDDKLLDVRFSQQPTQSSRARLFHDHPIATGAALGACLVATLMLTAVLSLSLQGFAIGCVIIILGGLVGAISTDSPKPNFA